MAEWLSGRRAFIAGAALVVAGAWLVYGQTQRAAAQTGTPAEQALRALNLGRYEEVDPLLQGLTDAGSAALRARALIARGRYADAEKLLAGPAGAEPGSDAALELGLLQLYLGRRAAGERTLNGVLDRSPQRSAADFLRLGLAARALGDFREANSYFREANRLAPGDAIVNAAWGEMFLEKGEMGEAQTSFQVALKTQEDHVAALVGLARIASQNNPPAAAAAIQRAVAANPRSVPVQLLIAEMALDNRRREDARSAIARALEVNPNSLEALALDAAAAFLEGREADFARRVEQALAVNPAYGEVYRVAGDHLARSYRFDEAVVLTRKALEMDPRNVRAYADLGMHLLRTGDEKEARVALETAFKGDPFNSSLVTRNLLEMLDKLDTFETITDGDIVMRFAPEELAVMREYALPLAKEALATLQRQYEFTVRGPILIEMFPVHDDFAVRTLGLPGMVGALGACFGRVVTLDSPRARPPGEFNWGETLWHELAHVITLQMSNNRLPRWASEGISGWEERRARPEWGRDGHMQFAQAMNEGRVIKLDAMNEAFSDGRTIGLAYYQSSLVIEHLVALYGEPRLRALLRAYGRGLDDEEAFREAFGVSVADVQASFEASIEQQFAGIRQAITAPPLKEKPGLEELKALAVSHPGSFVVHMQLGHALAAAGDHAAAIAAYERAATLVPRASGQNNPHGYIADAALAAGDTERAIRALEDKLHVDHSDVEAARRLVALVAPRGDPARTEAAYRRVVAVDPFDSRAQTGLGRLLLQRKDAEGALRALRAALGAGPPDRASAHTDVAEAYLLAGRASEAKREALAALEIAPSFERAQDLLLKILDAEKGA